MTFSVSGFKQKPVLDRSVADKRTEPSSKVNEPKLGEVLQNRQVPLERVMEAKARAGPEKLFRPIDTSFQQAQDLARSVSSQIVDTFGNDGDEDRSFDEIENSLAKIANTLNPGLNPERAKELLKP